MLARKLRVLVVDDTIVYRKAVSDILAEIPGVEVVGIAHNGKIAMSKIATLKPDLLTLDIEMPEMNGLEVLAELQKNHTDVGAIMLSTLTADGSHMTMKALELGAFDFILKPQSSANLQEGKDQIKSALLPMLEAFSNSGNARSLLGTKGVLTRPRTLFGKNTDSPLRPQATTGASTTPRTSIRRGKSEIVTIGISTGGPNALNQMLPLLPGDLGVPVVIVQHMPPIFTKSLAASLDAKCALTVKEAEDAELIQPNTVYIAPGGKQMKLVASADGKNRIIKITNDPPENSCRPSADYLFRSVGDYYVGRTTAVIMTGMGSDGTKGLQLLKQKGAFIIAQDEATCVVYGMPKAPIQQGLADVIAPLNKIANEITKSVK
ncbi:MAG: chemotaxis response regulator protein-glutamate methylesterase [Proteobacteria bacterium]|jgi:two-component system chemotaxis response regulator CheB|nr:chemotaxis response regulator protein-glutamate methylesterase [Desulfocapsa sp.]MBU3945620.1 chemotaxis response regulator protein-glutamate methylesterase [Pseudomonadota bacterium]MCG2745865.1 chemotaxis response regulator protein-glutamate methylesterase [Desulfobacteraceae bacterium]MBU3983687.1 chemotaxis response regulator protein-glutamate methylesterase [Pseudomonadota bacterium]MBU4029662.1 chemotaxis response regulator protein-glutamate methylesterase [Pseudomonadota bacterium]